MDNDDNRKSHQQTANDAGEFEGAIVISCVNAELRFLSVYACPWPFCKQEMLQDLSRRSTLTSIICGTYMCICVQWVRTNRDCVYKHVTLVNLNLLQQISGVLAFMKRSNQYLNRQLPNMTVNHN